MDRNHEHLRKKAEILLSDSNTEITHMSAEEIQELLSQLQVHQIELEMRNDELSKTNLELATSRERYAQLYNAGTVGYLTLNEDGLIQHANRAAAIILDCPVDKLVDKKLAAFILPDDQDKYYLFLRNYALQQPDQTLTVRLGFVAQPISSLQCPGMKLTNCTQESCSQYHRFTYLECRHAVNFDNNGNHDICLTINDVSDRIVAQESIACLNEKLEQKIAIQNKELLDSNLALQKKLEELSYSRHQLREREEKLNAIFNAAIEGIITIDKSGIIVSGNSAIETIFGYSPEELTGCNIATLIPVEKRKSHKGFVKTPVMHQYDRIRTVDGIRKDGSFVPLDISIAEFSIDGVKYFTSIVRDVSLRKLKEQEDKEHLDALAHVTRLGLMGEIASGIAHEVNQPLTAITGYTQACLNFAQAEKPDLIQLREILQKTYQQALKAGQIIHRMREFVTFRTIHRSKVEINDLINICISLCAADLKQNNIVQRFDLAKNSPDVYVDSVQIEQVMLNLIRNSIDALQNLPENTQRVLTIQSRLDDDHNSIEVRVKDNGPGIAKTEQEKILTPFYTTKKSGMGMGLSISQSIIKANGGTLTFNSKLGKGTTFYFTLPIQEQ